MCHFYLPTRYLHPSVFVFFHSYKSLSSLRSLLVTSLWCIRAATRRPLRSLISSLRPRLSLFDLALSACIHLSPSFSSSVCRLPFSRGAMPLLTGVIFVLYACIRARTAVSRLLLHLRFRFFCDGDSCGSNVEWKNVTAATAAAAVVAALEGMRC